MERVLIAENPEPVILFGLPGIGKSAIASGLSWGLVPFFCGGVVWVDGTDNDLEILCDEIGRIYDDEGMLSLGIVQKLRRARYLLNQQDTLVVVDNSSDRDFVQSISEEVTPKGLIVTTRERIALIGILVEIKSLELLSAINLFRRVSMIRGEHAEYIEEIVTLLDGHPQAICIAAALCLEENLSPGEMLELLKPAELRVRRLRLGQNLKNWVWASFEACYRRLELSAQSVFRMLGAAFSNTVSPELLATVMGNSEIISVDQILRQLTKHGLLDVIEDRLQEHRVYRMHELLRAYARGILFENENGFDNAQLDWIRGIVAYVKAHSQPNANNIHRLEIEIEHIIGAIKLTFDQRQWEIVNCLVSDLWHCGLLELRGFIIQGLEITQSGLVAAQRLNDDLLEAKHLTNLGTITYILGKYQIGAEYAKQALILARTLSRRSLEAENLLNLARFYRLFGQFDESIRTLEMALTIAREIGDKKRESDCLGHMGLDHYHLGKFDQAADFLSLALAIARDVGDYLNEGRHLSRLGDVCVDRGEIEQGICYIQQAIAIAREQKNRIGEQWDLAGLGRAYFELGQYEDAIDCIVKALNIAKSIEHREGQAYRSGSLAKIYARVGREDEGIDLAREALEISLDINHSRCECLSRCALAECYYAIGQKEKAIKEVKQAIDIATSIENRDLRADALQLLGEWAFKEGEYNEAYNYHKKELIHREDMGQQERTHQLKRLVDQLATP